MDSNLHLTPTVHTRALHRAAELLGGPGALGAYLGVSAVKLGIWMKGSIAPPGDVFLRVVDLLVEHDVASLRHHKMEGGHGDTDQAGSS